LLQMSNLRYRNTRQVFPTLTSDYIQLWQFLQKPSEFTVWRVRHNTFLCRRLYSSLGCKCYNISHGENRIIITWPNLFHRQIIHYRVRQKSLCQHVLLIFAAACTDSSYGKICGHFW